MHLRINALNHMDNSDYYEQQRAKWRRKRKNVEKRQQIQDDYEAATGKKS